MKSFILIKILKVKGSAPCDINSNIVFNSKNKFKGTIGGGNLEKQALEFALHLQKTDTNYGFLNIVLSPKIKQCCGGVVDLIFLKCFKNEDIFKKLQLERESFILISDYRNNAINRYIFNLGKKNNDIPSELVAKAQSLSFKNQIIKVYEKEVFFENFDFSNNQDVIIYGAGHIARHLVKLLSKLSFNIFVVDNRENEFLKFKSYKKRVNNKITFLLQDYLKPLNKPMQNPYHLIMTYNHSYDYDITKMLLKQKRIEYIGLIGSYKKSIRFHKHLKKENIKKENLDKLECPIGNKLKDKTPFAIALSIASHILTLPQNGNNYDLSITA